MAKHFSKRAAEGAPQAPRTLAASSQGAARSPQAPEGTPQDCARATQVPASAPQPPASARATARVRSRAAACYVAACLIGLSAPLWGRCFVGAEVTSSSGPQAQWPVLVTEAGTPNLGYLGQAGAWFEQNFAWRNELISADAALNAALLGEANTQQVVLGRDAWLYFGGELADYRGAELTERALDDIAWNLSMVQKYLAAHGARLVLAIAPNKSTLYPEHMPAWEIASAEPHAMERLLPYLDARGVPYADLLGVLRQAKATTAEPLYYLSDSHWNDTGAQLAAQEILRVAGVPDAGTAELVSAEMDGDLAAMLYPAGAAPEACLRFGTDAPGFAFADGQDDVTQAQLSCQGQGAETLVMYRDSFANNLIPALAPSFGTSVYAKPVPYDLTLATRAGAQVVVMERAERHLLGLATEVPAFPAPRYPDLTVAEELATASSIQLRQNGDYLVASGIADASVVDGASPLCVEVEGADGSRGVYEACHTVTEDERGQQSDWGFQAYLLAPASDTRVRFVTLRDGVWVACSDWVTCT